MANEQETWRRPYNGTEAASSNIDDKTMHELYLWPFVDGVRAGAASLMCSYNRLNNSYGCQNSKLMNGILKTELEFEGFVISDWHGQQSGVASALAGLDMVMPDSGFWGDSLTQAVMNGSVPEERVDDMATRCVFSFLSSFLFVPVYPISTGTILILAPQTGYWPPGISSARTVPTSPRQASASSLLTDHTHSSTPGAPTQDPFCWKVPPPAMSS